MPATWPLTRRRRRPCAVSRARQEAGARGPGRRCSTAACPWRGTRCPCCTVLSPPRPAEDPVGSALLSTRQPGLGPHPSVSQACRLLFWGLEAGTQGTLLQPSLPCCQVGWWRWPGPPLPFSNAPGKELPLGSEQPRGPALASPSVRVEPGMLLPQGCGGSWARDSFCTGWTLLLRQRLGDVQDAASPLRAPPCEEWGPRQLWGRQQSAGPAGPAGPAPGESDPRPRRAGQHCLRDLCPLKS